MQSGTLREPRLELLDARGIALDPNTTSLGFGLFDHAFERQYCPGDPYHDEADPLLDEPGEARNFVGSDTRRFYLRIRDEAPETRGLSASGQRFVTARWYTRGRDGTVLDDNPGSSEVTLAEEKPGEFVSKGLMLVTWEEDGRLAPHCGVQGRYPVGHEHRAYGSSDHRVRLASMFGDMVVEYPSGSSGVALRASLVAYPFQPSDRRCLSLHLFVSSRPGTRGPVATPEQLRTGLDRVRRVYESIGISVKTAPHPVAELLIGRQDSSIAKLAFDPGGEDFCYLIDARALLGPGVDLSRFDDRAFQAFCRRFPDAGRTVRVIYVDAFRDAKFGMACPEFDFSGRVEAGACACQPERYPERAITAHEVGHVLTNKGSRYGTIADQTNGFRQFGGHFTRPADPLDNRYIHFYNLMGGSRFRLYDVDVTEASSEGSELKTFNQYLDIRGSPFVK